MRIAMALLVLAACGDDAGPVFGGTRWDVPDGYWVSNLAFDDRGDVIVGGWSSDGPGHNGFIEKLDRDTGARLWTLALPDDSTVVSDIAVGAGADIAACGIFSGTIDFGGMTLETADGEFETFVASYDGEGRLRWAHSLGPGLDYEPSRIAMAGDGTVAVHGSFNGTLGTTTSMDYDEYVVVHDADGNLAWSHVDPAPGPQWAGDLAIAPDGDIVASGSERIVRLSPTGDSRWTRPRSGRGRSLEIEPGGDLLLAGRGDDNQIRIWRLDPSGAEVASFDLWRNDVGMSFALAPSGEIVAGGSLGSESIGEDSELYLVALDRDGAIVDSFRGPEWIDNLAIGPDGATVYGNQGRIVLLDAASAD
jgi:hypothetical protein